MKSKGCFFGFLVSGLLLMLGLPNAHGQGKVQFSTDSVHLVYYASTAGPLAGSAVWSNNLPAGINLVADLYMGPTNSSTLYLYSTATFSFSQGRWNTVNVQAIANTNGSPALPGGGTVNVQVIVRVSTNSPPVTWTLASTPYGAWFGKSQLFQFVLGASITYPPIWNVGGNWPVGTFPMDFVAAGDKGAIPVAPASSYMPMITQQPTNAIAAEGGSATFFVTATSQGSLTYQWKKDGQPLAGATNETCTVSSATTNDAGTYTVVVGNANGTVTSSAATLTVYVPVNIASQPVSAAAPGGAPATFSVTASGFPPPQYQWFFQGSAVSGATNSDLVIPHVAANKLGSYQVVMFNAYSSATSEVATLNMSPTAIEPFAGAVFIWGNPGTLEINAAGSGTLSYQWYFEGNLIAGATNGSFDFASVELTNAGIYSVVVASEFGSLTNTAQVVVNPANIAFGFYPGITIDGVVGFTYGIEYTTNLADPNRWIAYTNVTLTDPVQTWVDTVEVLSGPPRQYRVVAQPNQLP